MRGGRISEEVAAVAAMTVPRESTDHDNVVAKKKVQREFFRKEKVPDGVESMYSLKQTESSRNAKMAQDATNCYGSPPLQRNVKAWCDATGLPTTITIRCNDRVFQLHKVRYLASCRDSWNSRFVLVDLRAWDVES